MNRQLLDDDEAVLAAIKDEGTFDDLRRAALDELKTDPELMLFVEENVRSSKILNKAARDGADEKQLFEELRQDHDLEYEVSQKVLQKIWEITHGEQSKIAQQINHSVHQKLCAVYEERDHAAAAGATNGSR